jgi:8-oxo-dGTP pyrophosphatase MutT (NUDIX family)
MSVRARAVIPDGHGGVLFDRTHHAGKAPFYWLPGGGVEPGETLLAALARELREEGNIELTAPPVLHGVFYNPRWSRRDHVACFVAQSFHQSAPPAPNREIAATRFFALEELPGDTGARNRPPHPPVVLGLPGDTGAGSRARIAEVLLGAPVSEKW